MLRRVAHIVYKTVTIAALSSLAAAPAFAQETTTYTYDALGRLTDVSNTGGVNSGVETEIVYDAAGNRASYKVTGSSNAVAPGMFIVVPLNGFTLIRIPQ